MVVPGVDAVGNEQHRTITQQDVTATLMTTAWRGNRLESVRTRNVGSGRTDLTIRWSDLGHTGEQWRRVRPSKTATGPGTIKRNRLVSAQVVCEFDEFTRDVPHNQIVKAALGRVMRSPDVKRDLRRRAYRLRDRMSGVSDVPLSGALFRRVQLHSNNRFYKFLLNVCELALDLSLVDESYGDYRFQDFIRDDKKLARLFENFVLNFLARERPDLSIGRDHIQWKAESAADPTLAYLPRMETDISVRSRQAGKTLIIDTKFYKDTFSKRWDKESIHSAHLYQLFAYLKNLEYKDEADANADGMLLYPVVERSVKFEYQLKGHRLTVRTLNLAADWTEIRDELLALVPWEFGREAA